MKCEWQTIRLGDVCKLLNGRAYKKPELLPAGKFPVLRVGNFFSNRQWYYSDLELDEDKYCDNGDLLYAWSASFGPKIWDGGKVVYHYHIWKTVLDETHIDKKFLFYWFEWDVEKIQSEQGAGTTMIHVTKGSMENRTLRLPPLPEQKRIVSILDEAFEGIDRAVANAEKNFVNARELFESYLNKVFTGKGKGWVEKKLGDIAYLAGRIGWKGLTAKEYTKEGPLFISVHSLNYGDYVDYRDAFHISQERYDESPEIMLQPNDVLICKDGAGIGKMGIVEYVPSPATINSSLLIIRALEATQPKYLYRVLCGQTFQRLVQERIDGATTPHLYQREIKQLIVPVAPKAKQKEIIERLDKIRRETQRLESIYQRKLTALAELKQSLLQKAFSSELTANDSAIKKEAVA
jgi:type I restriction enzyme, S subunit